MSEYRVAARYAKSLLDLSIEQNKLDAVFSDMKNFATILRANKDLHNMLCSPIINGDKKMAVLNNVFANKFEALTMNFFAIVIRKKRESMLQAVADGFVEQYNTKFNIANASVKSAIELSESALAEIKSHLESQTGKKINLSSKVDAELIGGVVVQVGDRLFDASIAGKLGKLKQELLNSYISK